MSYAFQDRLRYNSTRMAEVNTEDVTYVGLRSGKTIRKPIVASPILVMPDEMSPGNDSLVMTTRQNWGIDVTEFGPQLFPPVQGDKIIRLNGSTFQVSSMEDDEPPYTDVTSSRERVIVHTVRSVR